MQESFRIVCVNARRRAAGVAELEMIAEQARLDDKHFDFLFIIEADGMSDVEAGVQTLALGDRVERCPMPQGCYSMKIIESRFQKHHVIQRPQACNRYTLMALRVDSDASDNPSKLNMHSNLNSNMGTSMTTLSSSSSST